MIYVLEDMLWMSTEQDNPMLANYCTNNITQSLIDSDFLSFETTNQILEWSVEFRNTFQSNKKEQKINNIWIG